MCVCVEINQELEESSLLYKLLVSFSGLSVILSSDVWARKMFQ